jgi:hypothetical protein
MKIKEYDEKIVFIFDATHTLTIDKKAKEIKFWDAKIDFKDVMGYWKNYHPGGGFFVYYVMLLTPKKIYKITPELQDEDSIDKILEFLKITVPREAKV